MLQQSYSHNYYEGRHATDFTPWLEYYAEGFRITLEETCEEIRRFQERGVFLNARQQKIMHDPRGHAVTPRAYAIRFGISTRMATRDLQQLTVWGFLCQFGKGRSTQYAPTQGEIGL